MTEGEIKWCAANLYLIDRNGEYAKWGRSLRGEAEIKKVFLWEYAERHHLTARPGDGAAAAVRGYHVAGKTGTAQKVVNGRYSSKYHTSSFVGIIPATRPRFVLLVTADEPQGAQYGGTVAGPYFSSAAERTLKFLRETPEVDFDTYDANLKIAKKREIDRKVRIWAKEREERERRKMGAAQKTAAPAVSAVRKNTKNSVRPQVRTQTRGSRRNLRREQASARPVKRTY